VELQKVLVEMFIALELSLWKADHEALHYFLNLRISQFKIPSRATLSCDILSLRDNEKIKLKTFLSQHCGRVFLTTDFWTSYQKVQLYVYDGPFCWQHLEVELEDFNFLSSVRPFRWGDGSNSMELLMHLGV
jgi:hypothetical protein